MSGGDFGGLGSSILKRMLVVFLMCLSFRIRRVFDVVLAVMDDCKIKSKRFRKDV